MLCKNSEYGIPMFFVDMINFVDFVFSHIVKENALIYNFLIGVMGYPQSRNCIDNRKVDVHSISYHS